MAPDRKRPWTKPRIRTMRLVAIDTRTGVNPANDEDNFTDPVNVAEYAPIS